MPIKQLNHFSIRTTDLEATRRFYTEVMGLTEGPRPPFPFPGVWLYTGPHDSYENATVHVIGIDPNDGEGLKAYLGDRDLSSLQGTGSVDHIAFFATGVAETLERLSRLGVPYRERTVPLLGLHQIFVDDPSAVVIELNFPASELANG
jgi:catechol 2,3-dioxygenase-like lactoylglutathione lyase family enzyme